MVPLPSEHAFCAMQCTGYFSNIMLSLFFDLVEVTMEVFMDDFFMVGDLFDSCLYYLSEVLEWCVETNLIFNLENSTLWLRKALC